MGVKLAPDVVCAGRGNSRFRPGYIAIMKPEKEQNQLFSKALKLGVDRLLLFGAQALSFARSSSGSGRSRFKELFDTTSDQVREKAEVTKRAVKLRMAVLEIEHHLNRLYPQIGKITCDLADQGVKAILQDEALKSRIEMADEYRERLKELKAEQQEQHSEERKKA